MPWSVGTVPQRQHGSLPSGKHSLVGGLILEIDEVLLEEDGKREDRFEITFQSMIEGKGQKWRGPKGPYVYNIGLIEVE